MIQQKQIKIKGMHCKSCAESIESGLKALPGIKNVNVSFAKERAFIDFDSEQASINTIEEKIKETGYQVGAEDSRDNDSVKTIKINLKSKKAIVSALCLALLITGVLTKGFGFMGEKQVDSFISIPLLEITTSAKWYEHNIDEDKVKFFVVKAANGSIKTALDACDVCYSEKKGYRQEGDYMVCNNCGNRYLISELGTKNKRPGGCWPGYLPNIIQGDNIMIKTSDLSK